MTIKNAAPSSPRLRLLARIHVNSVEGYVRSDGVTIDWFLYVEGYVKLRTASIRKLILDGDVVEVLNGPKADLALSESALADLTAERKALPTEQVLRATDAQHKIRYQMFSRGSARVRGMGITQGCKARCDCGWEYRSNQGRQDATLSARDHRAEAVAAALDAAFSE